MALFSLYWYSVFPLVSIVLCTLLLVRASSFLKTRPRQFFFLTVICLWFWIFDELVYPGVATQQLAQYVKSLGVTMISLTPVFYAFSMIYFERKPRWWEYVLLLTPLFIVPKIWIDPYPAIPTDMGWKINFNDHLYTVWHMVLGLCMLYGIARTFMVASKIEEPETKHKVNLLIVGAGICVVLAQVLTMIARANLHTFPYIGSIGAGLFCVFMSMALFKR
jgi:hypothetical protein